MLNITSVSGYSALVSQVVSPLGSSHKSGLPSLNLKKRPQPTAQPRTAQDPSTHQPWLSMPRVLLMASRSCAAMPTASQLPGSGLKGMQPL